MQDLGSMGRVLVLVLVASSVQGSQNILSRWTRQAVHCQAGDQACQTCSGSCNAIEVSRLPECCEAYNSCCDHYFQACKKCSTLATKDHYFPEYCCASFTDCCDLVTTFNTAVKPPEPVKAPVKQALKIPTVAAPKPTVFPGTPGQSPSLPPFDTSSSNIFQDPEPVFQLQDSPLLLEPQISPVFPVSQATSAGLQLETSPNFLQPQISPIQPAPIFPLSPATAVSGSEIPPTPILRPSKRPTNQQPQVSDRPQGDAKPRVSSRTQGVAKPRVSSRRPPARSNRPVRPSPQVVRANRRGRVTSRGRVLA